MRNRRDSPAQRASFLINHAIKYGDAHLRTGAFRLSEAQFIFIMFDIFAVLAAALVSMVTVAVCLCYAICRRCWRKTERIQKATLS